MKRSGQRSHCCFHKKKGKRMTGFFISHLIKKKVKRRGKHVNVILFDNMARAQRVFFFKGEGNKQVRRGSRGEQRRGVARVEQRKNRADRGEDQRREEEEEETGESGVESTRFRRDLGTDDCKCLHVHAVLR